MSPRRRTHWGASSAAFALFALVVHPAGAAAPGAPGREQAATSPVGEKPWRAHDALSVPAWLRFGLEHRARFEHLKDDFRKGATGSSAALSFRTLLPVELWLSPVAIGAELVDSRAYATESTPLNNTIVDPVDLLQAYAGLRQHGVFFDGDAASLTVGRFTMDVGSRRLVARNEFRNTINSFTGVDVKWTSPGHHTLRAFAVLPVTRLPTDPGALARNRVELDRENTDTLFWGAFFGSAPLEGGLQLETYVLGLHEQDSAEAPSANRRLVTAGTRALRAPAAGQLDFQVEAIVQLGTSRATTAATDTSDLTHRAGSLHGSVGYRFDVPGDPRVAAQYDLASGDADPGDGSNGRFDPLFGARRFELGPTGLYGALARSNISSPGARVEVAPLRTVDAFAGYRAVWLASSRDAWTTAGLRDQTGGSGSFLGHQLEARARWNVVPRNFALEVGAAYLVRGHFATAAPGARGENPVLVYTQLTVAI